MIDVHALLIENADPKYNEFSRGLTPGIETSYGVRTPVIHDIAKRILAEDDWEDYLKITPTCHEERLLQGLVIRNCKIPMKDRMGYVEQFVSTINNWALCDLFCGKWKMKKDEKQIMWNYALEQIQTGDEFRMRFGAVMMMGNYLDDEHIDEILRSVTENYNSGYYYIMGAAWCLSFCYIKFPERTEPYLFSDELDKKIMSKAIQKICDSYRVEKEDKERLKKMKRELLSRSPRSS